MTQHNSELQLAITASIDAGKAILDIYYKPDFESELKNDNSPLTEADLAASKIINNYLIDTPFHIINEEIKNKDYAERKTWETCWIVDPLDGTKEFVKRNGEFTVNIALCKNGAPVLGVIYVPVSRELYYADVTTQSAFKTILGENHELNSEILNEEDRIFPSKPNNSLMRVVGSRSHMNDTTLEFINEVEKNYEKVEIVSKGSSLKFCLVAEGKADVYPRFAPTMEWDTAAGQAICEAAGLKVISRKTNKELEYNKENLLNPHFIVST
jgi:3'(2'), 5'-bisphosphate nucleotidase